MIPLSDVMTRKRRDFLRSLMVAVPIVTLSAAALAQTAPPKVRIHTTAGDMVMELYPDKAPKTVENFLQYVRDKHYDGTIFHRVINNFMIQGGGYDANYRQKPTRTPIAHEGQAAIERGGPKNVVGTVAMARTGDPHSATAQFFINVNDNAFLNPTPIPPGDPVPRFEYRGQVYENIARSRLLSANELYGYTVFGKIIAGMDVVNAIKALPTGSGGPFPTDVPQSPVIILQATLEK